jgi:AraC-like DNA-binding protein
VDPLASLLYDVRANGARFGRSVMAAPWSVRFAGRAPLTLMTMLSGDSWIVAGEEPRKLRHGEVGIVAGTQPFTLADDPTAVAPEPHVLNGAQPESLDGPTALLTGSYQATDTVSSRLFSALPRVLVVPHEGELCPVMEMIETEIDRVGPGQQALLDRLLDLLLLATLREWFNRTDSHTPRWYRALGDPIVGPALRLMHERPAHPWTVASLAAAAAVSRATFARRFSDLLGEPPMTYLAGWRLSLAADLLRRTDATVDAVARRVGYVNAFALSVAFKRVYNIRPSDYRTAHVKPGLPDAYRLG